MAHNSLPCSVDGRCIAHRHLSRTTPDLSAFSASAANFLSDITFPVDMLGQRQTIDLSMQVAALSEVDLTQLAVNVGG